MTALRWGLGGGGVLLMAYAVAGALTDAQLNLVGVLVFLAAVLILHDAVWMPVILAGGVVLERLAPPSFRQTVPVIVLGVLVVAFPAVVTGARGPVVPLLIVLVVVLGGAALASRKKLERTGAARRR